jgi:hypothetical protein
METDSQSTSVDFVLRVGMPNHTDLNPLAGIFMTKTLTILSCIPVLLSSAACKPKGPPPVEPSDQVRYELPSHRCVGKNATCACRNPLDDADAPEKILVPDGYRRFELKLASLNPAILMTFSGQPFEFRTPGESMKAFCWYLDLPIGKTDVLLRSREFKEFVVQPAFSIAEYRTEDQRWVSVIEMQCGSPQNPCSPETIKAAKDTAFTQPSYDKCARSDIKSMSWNGAVASEFYSSLDLKFSLLVNAPIEQDPKCLQIKKEEASE